MKQNFKSVHTIWNRFFKENDLDYDPWVIIRREILPNGKSRAFVNDTPTNLSVLNGLTSQLIDIHSQHETLQLSDPTYQFHIIDSLADNNIYLEDYSHCFSGVQAYVKRVGGHRTKPAAGSKGI